MEKMTEQEIQDRAVDLLERLLKDDSAKLTRDECNLILTAVGVKPQDLLGAVVPDKFVLAIDILEPNGNRITGKRLAYDTLEEAETAAEAAWQAGAELEPNDVDDQDEEPQEPEEGDITTHDHRKFYQYGKLVLTVAEDDDHKARVREFMEREKFWPNVWFVSDHGNCHLMSLPEK